MTNKIDFLKKYRKKVELISDGDFLLENSNLIPKYWKEIFEILNQEDKIKKVIGLWEELALDDFKATISYLKNNLVNVEIIKTENGFSILYSLKSLSGKILYYEGRLPVKNINNQGLREIWNKVPNSIKRFYEKLHNGFFYYPGINMGLVPLEDVILFSDYEWGIIDELEKPLQINLSTTFGFFQTGMGGYVAIDLNNCNDNRATLWFSDDQPEYNRNFWNLVDEWVKIGLED